MPYKKPGDIFIKDNVVYRITHTRSENPCIMCDFKTHHNNTCSCYLPTGINSKVPCAILIGEHSYLKEVKGGI
jgi:hypothetical protein